MLELVRKTIKDKGLFIKNLLIKIHQWSLSHPAYVRPLHTFWQSFLGIFLVGISPILNDIISHHYADAKIALYALVGAAVAAGFSAAKNSLWPTVVSWASSSGVQITQPDLPTPE